MKVTKLILSNSQSPEPTKNKKKANFQLENVLN
jgi:hypothetical protein